MAVQHDPKQRSLCLELYYSLFTSVTSALCVCLSRLRTVEEDLRQFNLGLASGLRRAQNRTAWQTLTGTATSPTSSDWWKLLSDRSDAYKCSGREHEWPECCWASTSSAQHTLDPHYNALIQHRRPYCVIVRTALYRNERSVYVKQRFGQSQKIWIHNLLHCNRIRFIPRCVIARVQCSDGSRDLLHRPFKLHWLVLF